MAHKERIEKARAKLEYLRANPHPFAEHQDELETAAETELDAAERSVASEYGVPMGGRVRR